MREREKKERGRDARDAKRGREEGTKRERKREWKGDRRERKDVL